MTTSHNPLHGWQVNRSDIQWVGQDLLRPECILAEPDGTLWTADARGGVMTIAPDGKQTLIAQRSEHASTAQPSSQDAAHLLMGGADAGEVGR